MMAERYPWYEERNGILLVVLYGIAALLGGLVATGVLFPGIVDDGPSAATHQAYPVAIPPPIYIYAYLGALAHVFVSLAADADADPLALVQLGLRIPAALLVVTGGFLLVSAFSTPDATELTRELAGMAFLVGLFIEHTLRSLGSVSARLYPGDPTDLYVERRRS